MIPALIVIVSLVFLSVLHRPLIQLSNSAVQIAYTASEQIEEGLRSVTQAFRSWWGRSFARAFTLRAFLGGIILCGFMLAFVLADYTLLVMAIASLFPLETTKTRIFGLTLLPADQMAIAIVAGELLFGFLIFEILEITHFIPLDQGWTKRQRIIIVALLAAILLGLACITSGMAAWRTRQMQQMAIVESAAISSDAYDISADSSFLDATNLPGSTTPAASDVKPSFLDNLPTPAAAAVGFIVPVATALAGVGIYWLLLGLCGILSAVFVLMPMLLISWVAGVVTRIVQSLYMVLACLLRLLAIPVRIGTHRLSFQEKIDDDSILPLGTSGIDQEQKNARPSSTDAQGTDDGRTDSEDSSSTSRGDTVNRVEETATYTRDLEEEVAEYRSRDSRRAHNNTMNPLGMDTFNPESWNTEDDQS